MNNITLIGASGFVGTRLIELLKQNSNYHLTNIDKSQSPVYPEITTIVRPSVIFGEQGLHQTIQFEFVNPPKDDLIFVSE